MSGRVCFLFCLFTILPSCFRAGFYVDDVCSLKTREDTGICQLLKNCRTAITNLKKGILPHNCGFEGHEPIVCCFDTSDQTQTEFAAPVDNRKDIRRIPGKISKHKCQEYGKQVYKTVESPILDPNGKPYYANVSECTLNSVSLIVGGRRASPGQFPHQAEIGYDNDRGKSWLCDGTLISEHYVLTSVHCTSQEQYGSPTYIRLGSIEMEEYQEFEVVDIIKYPEQGLKSKSGVALLRMDRDAEFNKYVRPSCLETELNKGGSNTRFISSSYQFVDVDGYRQRSLLKYTLDEISTTKCKEILFLDEISEESQICTGRDEDSCRESQGSPLVIYNKEVHCMYKLVGVASSEENCMNRNLPQVFTRISHYIDWIEKNVWL